MGADGESLFKKNRTRIRLRFEAFTFASGYGGQVGETSDTEAADFHRLELYKIRNSNIEIRDKFKGSKFEISKQENKD